MAGEGRSLPNGIGNDSAGPGQERTFNSRLHARRAQARGAFPRQCEFFAQSHAADPL